MGLSFEWDADFGFLDVEEIRRERIDCFVMRILAILTFVLCVFVYLCRSGFFLGAFCRYVVHACDISCSRGYKHFSC